MMMSGSQVKRASGMIRNRNVVADDDVFVCVCLEE